MLIPGIDSRPLTSAATGILEAFQEDEQKRTDICFILSDAGERLMVRLVNPRADCPRVAPAPKK